MQKIIIVPSLWNREVGDVIYRGRSEIWTVVAMLPTWDSGVQQTKLIVEVTNS